MNLNSDQVDDFLDDDAVLAGLDSLGDDDSDQGTIDEPAEAPDPVEADSDASDEEAEPSDPEADEPEKTEEAPADEELTKRLEAIQKAEERQKTSIEEHRAKGLQELEIREKEFQVKQEELAPQLAELKEFRQLKEQFSYDPASVLAKLGLTPEQYDAHARMIYSMRPEAMNDPKTRDQAQRMVAARKQSDVVTNLEKEIQQLKENQAERAKAEETAKVNAANDQAVSQYMDKVQALVGDESPIVSRMMEKNATGTRESLKYIADRLADEYGEAPDPAAVVKELEKRRRDELIELGIDVDTAIKATPKNQTEQAGEMRAAKTLTNNLGTPTRPRTEPKTEQELDAEIMQELDF